MLCLGPKPALSLMILDQIKGVEIRNRIRAPTLVKNRTDYTTFWVHSTYIRWKRKKVISEIKIGFMSYFDLIKCLKLIK